MLSKSPVTDGELLLAIDDDENQLRMFSSRFGAAVATATGADACPPPPPPLDTTSPLGDATTTTAADDDDGDNDESTRPYCCSAWCGDGCCCDGCCWDVFVVVGVVDDDEVMALLLLLLGGMLIALMLFSALTLSVAISAMPTRSSSMSSAHRIGSHTGTGGHKHTERVTEPPND